MADFGLLGEHLGHSFSPFLHKEFGGYDYDLIEKCPEELADFLKSGDFKGINVTIPYKKAVIPYCVELSPAAAKIGSVNTILRTEKGLTGDNTDYYGFMMTVRRCGIDLEGMKALVLGDGGVAPTVRAVLLDCGAEPIVTVSRKGENNYVNLEKHRDAQIIVNATPVGMYPRNGGCLVDPADFPQLRAVFDLVYNPLRTELVMRSEALGIPAYGGLYMLTAQAHRASELFTGREIMLKELDRVYAQLLSSVSGIALIGMPGSGKSSCAKELCKLTGRECIDIDEEIEWNIGCTIPEYFAAHSEAEFRSVETDVLREAAKRPGAVIACGGGIVTRPENYRLLHQNCVIVRLERDLNELPTDGRPLSKAKSVARLAKERQPLYEAWSDGCVRAPSPEAAARKVLEVFYENLRH